MLTFRHAKRHSYSSGLQHNFHPLATQVSLSLKSSGANLHPFWSTLGFAMLAKPTMIWHICKLRLYLLIMSAPEDISVQRRKRLECWTIPDVE
eukprot:421375-Amorphochlora_amoeboformis.AAC.1